MHPERTESFKIELASMTLAAARFNAQTPRRHWSHAVSPDSRVQFSSPSPVGACTAITNRSSAGERVRAQGRFR
jgi:hypothetical protein